MEHPNGETPSLTDSIVFEAAYILMLSSFYHVTIHGKRPITLRFFKRDLAHSSYVHTVPDKFVSATLIFRIHTSPVETEEFS